MLNDDKKPCPHKRQATTALGAMTGTGWTCKDCGALLSETPAPDQITREEVEEATAGYEKATDLGPDMVYVPNDEIDMILVNTMRSRAESLRVEGKNDLAGHLEQAADRLYENVSEEVRAFCAALDESEGYL